MGSDRCPDARRRTRLLPPAEMQPDDFQVLDDGGPRPHWYPVPPGPRRLFVRAADMAIDRRARWQAACDPRDKARPRPRSVRSDPTPVAPLPANTAERDRQVNEAACFGSSAGAQQYTPASRSIAQVLRGRVASSIGQSRSIKPGDHQHSTVKGPLGRSQARRGFPQGRPASTRCVVTPELCLHRGLDWGKTSQECQRQQRFFCDGHRVRRCFATQPEARVCRLQRCGKHGRGLGRVVALAFAIRCGSGID